MSRVVHYVVVPALFVLPILATGCASHCPVTGKEVVATEGVPQIQTEYQGRRYVFCCERCRSEFVKEPAKFVESPVFQPGDTYIPY